MKITFITLLMMVACARIDKPKDVIWSQYASDAFASKFTSANQINKKNVQNLKVVWDYTSPDGPYLKSTGLTTLYNESTPLMVDGKVILATPLNQIVALNPESGEEVWIFDPKVYEDGYPVVQGFVQRGLAYWENGKRIFAATNNGFLLSIDITTGKLISKTDLKNGLSKPANNQNYGQTSPPIICGDVVIVGSTVSDFVNNFSAPRGDVRGYDLNSGKLKWTFHTVPQNLEYGTETWKNKSWKRMGNVNVWAPMSADLEENLVYLPVSTPSNDFYGGERHGDGLFGDSLVALHCESGKRKWHFQLVHHGLWDYDPPAAPVLFNLKNKKLVAQVTKQGFVFVFDRLTGTPVWPIKEVPVTQSKIPGEETSPTQPYPTLPLPFERQGISHEDLIDFTAELKEEASNILNQYEFGKLFSPPSEKGTVMLPGLVGGASWSGAAYNPVTEKIYIPSVTQPNVARLQKNSKQGETAFVRDVKSARIKAPANGSIPLIKPPYGRVTAIDMNTGLHSWMKVIGRGPKDILKQREDLGWARRIHIFSTPEIMFAAQEGESEPVGLQNQLQTLIYKIKNSEPFLRAFDAQTGKLLVEILLPKNAYGAPMSYIYRGKQFIVLPYGGANLTAGWIALTVK